MDNAIKGGVEAIFAVAEQDQFSIIKPTAPYYSLNEVRWGVRSNAHILVGGAEALKNMAQKRLSEALSSSPNPDIAFIKRQILREITDTYDRRASEMIGDSELVMVYSR